MRERTRFQMQLQLFSRPFGLATAPYDWLTRAPYPNPARHAQLHVTLVAKKFWVADAASKICLICSEKFTPSRRR